MRSFTARYYLQRCEDLHELNKRIEQRPTYRNYTPIFAKHIKHINRCLLSIASLGHGTPLPTSSSRNFAARVRMAIEILEIEMRFCAKNGFAELLALSDQAERCAILTWSHEHNGNAKTAELASRAADRLRKGQALKRKVDSFLERIRE